MFPIERQQRILDILGDKKSILVSDLSRQFFTSEATIRRDLEKLEQKGLLKRTYGGAVLLDGIDMEIPLSIRLTEHIDAKEIIGKLAAQLVNDGDVLIMDSGSTTLKMVPYLKARSRLTVITNGARTAIDLGELSGIKVYATGGILRENSLSYVGEPARRLIESYNADTLFFSCRAISKEQGITDGSDEEAELRRIMIRQCKKVVLLCDSAKFDCISFCKICDIHVIDAIVTDRPPSSGWLELLKRSSIEVVCP